MRQVVDFILDDELKYKEIENFLEQKGDWLFITITCACYYFPWFILTSLWKIYLVQQLFLMRGYREYQDIKNSDFILIVDRAIWWLIAAENLRLL